MFATQVCLFELLKGLGSAWVLGSVSSLSISGNNNNHNQANNNKRMS